MDADSARERRAGSADAPTERAIAPGTMTALLGELVGAGAPALPGPELRRGDRLGRFEILGELGRGGFGVVYEARDVSLRRSVAVKVLRRATGDLAARALVEEAEAAAQLQHPNIVALHDVGSHDGQPYVVMELLRGGALAERLERGGVPAREAAEIAIQISRGLAHAHARGVLHRDLTPGNVFLCEDGTVKLLDFGLSRLLGGDAKAGGTPGYAAPEQWRGEDEGPRTDVFALGVIVHRMVTGALPYPAPLTGAPSQGSAPASGRGAAVPATPGLPRRIATLVRRMLSLDPASRPADGEAVLVELLRAQRASVRLRWAGATALAIALALAAGWLSTRRGETGGEPALVAVADVANETGDEELDALSGLLITSLEQSRRIRVMTRARMFDVMKQLGMAAMARPDEGAAREIARHAGATALLVSTVRRFGDLYSIETKALDPTGDTYLFTAKADGKGKESVPGMLDALADKVRVRMREPEAEARAASMSSAEITTNLEAYRHYFRGQELAARWLSVQDLDEAEREFERAVELDSGFGSALYELALLKMYSSKHPESEARESIARALGARRLPQKERQILTAKQAEYDGNIDESIRVLRDVLSSYPDEKHALLSLASALWNYQHDRAAIPLAERLLELDPSSSWTGLLMWMQFETRRPDEVVEFWRRRATAKPSPHTLRDLSIAYLSAGKPEEALEPARRSGVPRAALSALYMMDDYESLQREISAEPPSAGNSLRRAFVAVARGREREARDHLAAAIENGQARPLPQALLLAGIGPPAAFQSAARAACDSHAGTCPHVALLAAISGQVEFGRGLLERSSTSVPIELGADESEARDALDVAALLASGDAPAAAARARAIPRPTPSTRHLSGYLQGEACFAARDYRCALAGYADYRSSFLSPLGTGAWRSWAYPRVLYREAVAHEALGELPEARERVDRLLRLWKDADPDQPLLIEARALQKRLAR